ncbi:bleomycin resistance protein [Methylobacterium sp. J-090]|uniref:bleomycin resistance protein n=1 Tax=Methylobacterium sp. J-090 TaxID=2836666 RepID=UPI001FBAB5FC|nr:VOC family protein [Methylobacterium sp. J-090]MCJ2083990.1 VOC family protein [Methylobacterium sp. J-090]
MGSLTRVCPLLAAPDPGAAADWYRDKLGFVVGLVMDGYAIVEREGVELHFWACPDRTIAENTSAYIRVTDIESVRAGLEAAAEGGRISPVQTREWGMREFYVWDPAGNLLRFGEPDAAAATRETRQ